MMTFSSLSQSIKNDSIIIGKKTFISIVKESRKCDSLRVAYEVKSVDFKNLINENMGMLIEVEEERRSRLKAEERMNEISKDNFKLIKKNKSIVFWGIGGVAIGVAGSLLIF